jgi:hypothetical protein
MKWSIVEHIIGDEPTQQEGEEAIHEVLLEYIFGLYCILIHS